MFGQRPARTRCYGNGSPMPLDSRENMMTALGRAGYLRHGIGKCHFSPHATAHENNGFSSRERQEEIVSRLDHDEYHMYLRENGLDHITDTHGVRGDMYYVPQPAQMSAKNHPTQWIGDRSVAFLRDRAGSSEPWYLFSSFIHPHPPFCPPAPWHKLYRDLDVPMPFLPPDYESLLIHVNRHQNRYKRRDRGLDLQLIRMMRAYYYACVSFIDFQVGRILRTLEETGQLDNTAVVFCSDHGELLGDYGSFGKRSYHEPVCRVPLLVRHPGLFESGARCDTPVGHLDITRTMLDLAGASFSDHACEGDNLRDIASNAGEDRMVFSQLNRAESGIYMAVNRRWKYVHSAPDQRELLFDRLRDPQDTRDLAGRTWDRKFESVRAQIEMKKALIDQLRADGESDALDGEDWRKYPKRQMPENPDAGLLYQDHPWADQSIPGYTD
jgi:arylsulfatase A-like enzyme